MYGAGLYRPLTPGLDLHPSHRLEILYLDRVDEEGPAAHGEAHRDGTRAGHRGQHDEQGGERDPAGGAEEALT
jgi:hypothetical protein